MELKITQFGFVFAMKSRNETMRENSIAKREKMTNFIKLN